jgi:hypothetical protein
MKLHLRVYLETVWHSESKNEQNYVQIYHTKFHPDRAVNTKSMVSNSFTTLKYGFHCADFHETRNSQIKFVDISSTENYLSGFKNVENRVKLHASLPDKFLQETPIPNFVKIRSAF